MAIEQLGPAKAWGQHCVVLSGLQTQLGRQVQGRLRERSQVLG